MRFRINGVYVDLTDNEVKQLLDGKIPDKIKQLGELKLTKVYNMDGSFKEKECTVYKFELIETE